MASGYITRDIQFLRKHWMGILVISLIVTSGIVTVEFNALQNRNSTDTFNVKGYLAIYKDGVLVGKGADTLSLDMWTYMSTKLFNLTTGYGFNPLNTYWYGSGAVSNGCHSYSSSGTVDVPNTFSANTRCSASALWLTTDTATVNNNQEACSSGATILNSNGFSPIKGTSSWTGVGNGGSSVANTLTISGSWTATGTVNGINRICLGLWNDKNNAYVTPNNTGGSLACNFATQPTTCPALAVDNFPNGGVSFTNGQILTVTWTFVM